MRTLKTMVGFVVATDMNKARAFYSGVLGFVPLGEDPHGMTFKAHGAKLRVVRASEFTPAQGTVLGWEVDDIHDAVRELAGQGVHFEQYNLPYMKQDAVGVWTTPHGAQVAWFKDGEGNVLSISKHPA